MIGVVKIVRLTIDSAPAPRLRWQLSATGPSPSSACGDAAKADGASGQLLMGDVPGVGGNAVIGPAALLVRP